LIKLEFTNVCKQKAIIVQLLDPEFINEIPLPKVTLPVETLPRPKGMNQELQNLSFVSSSPL
jgi:hypothetical protein